MGERLAFGRALHLNDATVFGHHHVHIGFRGGIFHVLQIANGFTINNTDGDGGNHALHRVGLQFTGSDQLVQRIGQRDAGAGDGSGAGTAVGLQHIAVERNGELAQRFQIYRSAQRASDQTLDFHGAAALLAFGGFASVTGMS